MCKACFDGGSRSSCRRRVHVQLQVYTAQLLQHVPCTHCTAYRTTAQCLAVLQMAGGSGGISAVQVKGQNSGWTGLHNLYGAEWELDTQPQLPLDLHISADNGAEVSEAHPALLPVTPVLSC